MWLLLLLLLLLHLLLWLLLLLLLRGCNRRSQGQSGNCRRGSWLWGWRSNC